MVQYYQADADFNNKNHKNATKVMRFKISQILQKISPNFQSTQFVGVKIIVRKKLQAKKIFREIFSGEFFLFLENIFGGRFYISQFVPL